MHSLPKAHTNTLAQHPGNVTSEPALVTSTCNYLHIDSSLKWDFPPRPPQTMKVKVKDPGGSKGTELSLGQEDSPGEGNSYPLQYSCLEKPMEKGAWRALQSIGSQRTGHD